MATPNETPPDYGTPIGQVRALIPDVEPLEDPADLSADPDYIIHDDIIQSYIALARGSVFRAAAIAVNTIATTEALILKVLKSDDRQTDGAKLADSLGRRADWLMKQADDEEDEDALHEAFGIYPYIPVPALRGLR